jgi:hypothetical protein
MSIPCLIFVKLLIPQHRVSCYDFWMPILAIIKSVLSLTMKKNSVNHSIWNLLL